MGWMTISQRKHLLTVAHIASFSGLEPLFTDVQGFRPFTFILEISCPNTQNSPSTYQTKNVFLSPCLLLAWSFHRQADMCRHSIWELHGVLNTEKGFEGE